MSSEQLNSDTLLGLLDRLEHETTGRALRVDITGDHVGNIVKAMNARLEMRAFEARLEVAKIRQMEKVVSQLQYVNANLNELVKDVHVIAEET